MSSSCCVVRPARSVTDLYAREINSVDLKVHCRDFAGKSECGDFKFTGIACILHFEMKETICFIIFQ